MVTFTIDPKRYDSNDPLIVQKCVNTFRTNLHNRLDSYYYFILFPDFATTDQGIHFHGLLRCIDASLFLSDSGLRDKYGIIYNLPKWSYGFSTVIELDSSPAVLKYCTKYFNKQGSWTNKLLPKHFYSFGKEPEFYFEYNNAKIFGISQGLPNMKKRKTVDYKLFFDMCEKYGSPLSSAQDGQLPY